MRNYMRLNRERETERKHRERIKYPERQGLYRRKHRGKVHAVSAVFYAVRTGNLIRPDMCSECSRKCKPEGHHDDYSKPLEVIWLCTECHGKRHRAPVS